MGFPDSPQCDNSTLNVVTLFCDEWLQKIHATFHHRYLPPGSCSYHDSSMSRNSPSSELNRVTLTIYYHHCLVDVFFDAVQNYCSQGHAPQIAIRLSFSAQLECGSISADPVNRVFEIKAMHAPRHCSPCR